MASFDVAIVYVLKNEGGYTHNPADRGGPTNFGITEKEARAHGYTGDMRNFPLDQAKNIYKQDYWKFDGIASQKVATKLLDMAVNMGLVTTVKTAQLIVGTTPDGIMGAKTIAAINSRSTMLTDLMFMCVRRYAHIVGADHSQAAFIVGWIERALKMPD